MFNSKTRSLQERIGQSGLEGFANLISSLSLQEIALSFLLMQTASGIASKEKLELLLKSIDSPALLEKLGERLSTDQFLEYLRILIDHPAFEHQLPSILVGLLPSVFLHSLSKIGNAELELLKHESLHEPIHFHLVQMIHQGEHLAKQTEKASRSLTAEFQSSKEEDLTPTKLDHLLNSIETLKTPLHHYFKEINRALSLVWHTDRIDLIERLSTMKETIHHQLTQHIGSPSTDQRLATGLYAVLETQFSSIYDSALQDSDTAMEGLTRLSIWYLKDYWELGLLPSIDVPANLSLDPQQFSEEECKQYQQHLLTLVQDLLNQLHIGTVGALKKARIYSKPLLKAYIARSI